MIVVTKIETIECDQDDFYTYADLPKNVIKAYAGDSAVKKSFELESIRGMTFVKMNGDVVVIGMSKQAQEAIGLPLEAFDTLQREVADVRAEWYKMGREKEGLQKDLDSTTAAKWEIEKQLNGELVHSDNMVNKLGELRRAGLWQRIKWVFTGVTIK